MKKVLLACAALMFAATACPVDTPTPTNWAVCPTAAAGQVQVAVVTEGVPDTSHEVVCVVVASGANGLDALNARAVRIGTPLPRTKHFSFGDQVCAIDDNVVAPECGDLPGDATGYRSWNYSNGGTAWTGSTVGAAATTVHQGSVEGWNFGTWNYDTTFPTNPVHSPSFAVLTAG